MIKIPQNTKRILEAIENIEQQIIGKQGINPFFLSLSQREKRRNMVIDEHTDLDQAWQEAKYITLWQLAFCYAYGRKVSAEFAEWLWDGFNCLFCDVSFEYKLRKLEGRKLVGSTIDRCHDFCKIRELCFRWKEERYKFLPDILAYYFYCLLGMEV